MAFPNEWAGWGLVIKRPRLEVAIASSFVQIPAIESMHLNAVRSPLNFLNLG